jgi:hypothetical protein
MTLSFLLLDVTGIDKHSGLESREYGRKGPSL